jgi:hypothetical protein
MIDLVLALALATLTLALLLRRGLFLERQAGRLENAARASLLARMDPARGTDMIAEELAQSPDFHSKTLEALRPVPPMTLSMLLHSGRIAVGWTVLLWCCLVGIGWGALGVVRWWISSSAP